MGLRGNPWEVIAYGPPWDGILITALILPQGTHGGKFDVATSVENVEIL